MYLHREYSPQSKNDSRKLNITPTTNNQKDNPKDYKVITISAN